MIFALVSRASASTVSAVTPGVSAPSWRSRRPEARSARAGLDRCRYLAAYGRLRLPRARLTPTTVSAFRIARASPGGCVWSPGPLCPVPGSPVLPGRASHRRRRRGRRRPRAHTPSAISRSVRPCTLRARRRRPTPPLAAMRSRSPVRRRVRRAKVGRAAPDRLARRRGGEAGAVPPLGIGVQAVELSPSHAGLAGRDHTRRLLSPAFPTCSWPLQRAPSGASDGPEVSLRTSLDWVQDSVPRPAAHPCTASGSPVPYFPCLWLVVCPSLGCW
jgi:hypothetical protein